MKTKFLLALFFMLPFFLAAEENEGSDNNENEREVYHDTHGNESYAPDEYPTDIDYPMDSGEARPGIW